MAEVTESKEHLVTQSNHLIKAAYEMSLNEKRLLMLALSKVNPHKWEQEWEITCYATEWATIYDKHLRHCYTDMENACDLILERKLVFRSGPDLKVKEKGRWVSWAKYYSGEGKVTLEIPKGLRKYLAFALLEEEGFTTYKLLAAGKLRSPNSIRVYSFLMQFKKTGTLIIPVEELRERLDLGDRYKLFADLRKWVIEPAVDDIDKNSDYKARWDVSKRTGRKITHLRFIFTEKRQKTLDFEAV